MPTATALTAVHKLELSQLDTQKIQKEMMGDDLDLEKLVVYLKSKILFDSASRVIDVVVNRTIDGASSVEIEMNDYDRSLLRSGALNARLDIEIDGLWFRLVKVSRDAGSDSLHLTFEQREIAILRTYPKAQQSHNGVKWANRDKVTRAQFILNLIREVKEFKIPVVMPHLHQVQKIEKKVDSPSTIDWGLKDNTTQNGDAGIPQDVNANVPEKVLQRNASYPTYVTVKGNPIEKDQRNNANTILTVASNMKANRRVMMCSIMTAIQESILHNLSGGDGTSVGLFQQIDTGWGSYADRHDPATSSRMFLTKCMKYEREHPGFSLNDVCQGVQQSGHPDMYAQWQDEANKIVSAFGIPPSKDDSGNEGTAADMNNMAQNWTPAGGDSSYYYYRGVPTQSGTNFKREDNWTCIRRLADEVGWRAFFISGVFYFLTDDDLYKTQPIATITESTKGIMGIGFDYDLGKKGATVDIPAMVGLWLAPPGSIISLQEMGPLDGRWLVNTFARSLFNSQADINLSKPQPTLPEPLDDNFTLPTWAGAHRSAASDPSQDQALFGGLAGTNGSRQAVVNIAEKAYADEQKWHYHYLQKRPYPVTLWSAEAHAGIDCSAFSTLVYKEAGAADPSGSNYSGNANTGTMAANGTTVLYPSPGDLVFYGGTTGFPEHVGVAVGGGKVIEIGSENGILKIDWNYRSVIVIKSYLPI